MACTRDGHNACTAILPRPPAPLKLRAVQCHVAQVGLEAEFKNDTERRRFKFARRKQFLQWTMGFAP